MMLPMPLMASMASPATRWISEICSEISSVAFAVWLASDLTSEATTAAAGLAGARGLDGGVERQEVGLGRDGVDEAYDFADPPRRLGEPLDGAVGVTRLADRAAGDARRRAPPAG